MEQGYLADMMMGEIRRVTPIITKLEPVSEKSVFIITSMREGYQMLVNVVDDERCDAFQRTGELWDKKSWAKVKIGNGEFCEFQEEQ